MRYFVDTNIIGYLSRAGSFEGDAYFEMISAEEFARLTPSVSLTVIDEITRGLPALDTGSAVQRQTAGLVRAVLASFEEVPTDNETDDIAELLRREARKAGHPIGADSQTSDLEIAALAIRHRAPLISHNYSDFINIDALDLRTLATIRKSPPRVTFEFNAP